MRRKLLLAVGALTVLALTGCSSTPIACNADEKPEVLCGVVNEDFTDRAPTQGVYFLGAGDELGEAVFTIYVAWLRENGGPRYATGTDPRPEDF